MSRKERQSVTFAGQTDMLKPTDCPEHTVANAPDATAHEGRMIYVSNGAAGSPVLAFSNGTNWLRSDTLAAIS